MIYDGKGALKFDFKVDCVNLKLIATYLLIFLQLFCNRITALLLASFIVCVVGARCLF